MWTKAGHICTYQSEPVALEKVFNITGIASGEVVETDDFVAFVQEAFTEVRSEKPSSSSHSSASTFHVSPLPRNQVVRPPVRNSSGPTW
jgi:hypothetical protein